MAFLFNINGKVVYPNAETLMVQPFKEIWDRDESEGKENALEDFAYIEFMVSMKKSNPYRQYSEESKEAVIRRATITRGGWTPDELIEEGMESIVIFQEQASTTYAYYIAAKNAAEKMIDFFNEVDVNERNEKGVPIYKPRDITSALNDTEKVLANLKALEKKVEEELYEETKNRSDKQISPFANPSSLKH